MRSSLTSRSGSTWRHQASVRSVQCRASPGPCRLIYFNAPARAEAARLMLTLGKIDFEDVRITREEWAALKPTTPYGQLPILEVRGKQLAQSSAIDRYVAKFTGHYPNESWEQACVDSIVAFTEEFFQQFIPVFSIKDPEARLAAVKGVVEGGLATRLERLDKMLAALPPNGYLVGSSFTWAEIACYCVVCNLTNGLFPGVPTNLYDKYPAIAAFKDRIASLPAIKAYYEEGVNATDPARASFKPSTATVSA